MVSIEPIGDFVVVKKIDSDVEVNGILLPEQTNQQIIRGEVIARGPGKHVEGDAYKRHHMQCQVGDIILVNSLACAPQILPIEIEGEFMLIPEADIAAIVRE